MQELERLLGLHPLERHALVTCALGSVEQRRKAFTAYLAIREKISVDYLPLVSSRQPFINDHTRSHLERVLTHIEALLERNFPSARSAVADVVESRLITWADTVIILNALAWHDIGNIHGRSGHSAMVKECFGAVSGFLYDDFMRSYIERVAEAHSGTRAIEKVIPTGTAVTHYNGDDVHLGFLAAVLRFADELDEDQRRIAPNEWQKMKRGGTELIPESNQRFWFFSGVNSSIKVRCESGAHNLVHRVFISSHVPGSHFDHLYHFADADESQPRKEVKALVEYFRRILKIEHERQYCNKFLKTAYYHPGIAGIHVALSTHEPGSPASDKKLYEFDLSDTQAPADLMAQFEDLAPYIAAALET